MKDVRSQFRILQLIALVAAINCVAGNAHCAEPPAPRKIDSRRAAAAGIRILDGRHLQLLTDLPSSPAVDELPALFDAAVPLWAKHFGLLESSIDGKWLALLISDREKFAALDLLPEENPDFINGYARNFEFWLMEQPSDYYRRHLLLHEGTHAFMQTQLGGAGPGWYMEGMAELLGTHDWKEGRLKLGVMPTSKETVPMWGRVKIIRDAVAAGKPWPLDAVLEVDNRRALSTEHYAWTWALASLLDAHPQFQERFRSLQEHVVDPEFNRRFRKLFAADWSDLLAEWEAYVAQLDYGYDVPRMAMIHEEPAPVGKSSQRKKIAADHGWQSTGWLLRAGETYRVTASGRYQIANDGERWPCEPGGVTLEYHDGNLLGALLGAMWSSKPDPSDPSFAKPMLIGSEAIIRPKSEGILYLRVNDSPAKLRDNVGAIEVRLAPAK